MSLHRKWRDTEALSFYKRYNPIKLRSSCSVMKHEIAEQFNFIMSSMKWEEKSNRKNLGFIREQLEIICSPKKPVQPSMQARQYIVSDEHWSEVGCWAWAFQCGNVLVTIGGKWNPLVMASHRDTLDIISASRKDNGRLRPTTLWADIGQRTADGENWLFAVRRQGLYRSCVNIELMSAWQMKMETGKGKWEYANPAGCGNVESKEITRCTESPGRRYHLLWIMDCGHGSGYIRNRFGWWHLAQQSTAWDEGSEDRRGLHCIMWVSLLFWLCWRSRTWRSYVPWIQRNDFSAGMGCVVWSWIFERVSIHLHEVPKH